MKNFFARIELAVQALADGKDNHGKRKRKSTMPPPAAEEKFYLPIAAEFTTQRRSTQFNSTIDIYGDAAADPELATARPRTHHGSSPTIRTRAMDGVPELPVRSSSRSFNRSSASPGVISSKGPPNEDNPIDLPSGQKQEKSLKRRNHSSSSTIFMNSPLAPVTIIVTTPDDDVPSPPPSPPQPTNSFNQIRAQRFQQPHHVNDSTKSLPGTHHSHNFSTDSLSVPDSNRLKPPTENQIDTHRLRKAKEFREIRRFIIQFMNTKGDQFPKKLRSRLMEAYSISDSDLDPDVVAKFSFVDVSQGENRDEGVALESLGVGEEDERDHMVILQSAFRSVIPQVTPKREPGYDNNIPPFRNRHGSLGARKATKTIKEEEAAGYFGPVAATRSTADLSIAAARKSRQQSPKMTRAFSEPNLHRLKPASDVPPVPALPSSQDLTGIAARNVSLPVDKKLKIVDQQTRVKRQNIISGAFGAVREAMGGTKSGKGEVKRKMMIEVL